MKDLIIEKFYNEMENSDLNVYGILDTKNNIHTLGTDSKLIGRIFEMLIEPVLLKIANEMGLTLITPRVQNIYPDFILMKNENDQQKIAIDVKTTYIEKENSNMVFTLGAFGSYMRNNTKNIEYKYSDYYKHYVIGFVYERNDEAQQSKQYSLQNKDEISCPYKNVKYFIQEKYKIVGEKPGSGNTENIGSIITNKFNDFVQGNGPFSKLGEIIYNIYWQYYPRYKSEKKEEDYRNLDEFFIWFKNLGRLPNTIIKCNYDYDSLLKIIENYSK